MSKSQKRTPSAAGFAVRSAFALKYGIDEVIKKANSYLDKEAVGYVWDDPMRTLSAISGNLLNRFIYMGYAYNLTGDKKYVDKAYDDIM